MSTKKKYTTRHVRWAKDFDYLDKLSAKEREWLEKFSDEYYEGKVKKGDPKAFNQGVVRCPTCKGTGMEKVKDRKLKKFVEVKCATCRKRPGRFDIRKDCYTRKNRSRDDLMSFKGVLKHNRESSDES